MVSILNVASVSGTSMPLAGSPLPGDVLLAVTGTIVASPTVPTSIAGWAATWTLVHSSARSTVWVGVNPTTGGSVAYSGGSTASGVVWHLRDVDPSTITVTEVFSAAVSTLIEVAAQSAGVTQAVLAMSRSGGAITTSSLPAGVWTGGTATNRAWAHTVPATPDTYQAKLTTSGTTPPAGAVNATLTMVVIGTPPPGPPTGLTLTPGLNNILTSWTAPGGTPATGYTVKVGAGAPTDVGNVTSFDVTGLTSDTNYTIEVRAYNAGGTSSPVSGNATTLDLPDPPTSLTQTGATTSSVTTGWVAPTTGSAPTSYDRRVDGGAVTNLGNVLTDTVSGLDPSTTYDVEIRSVNSIGVSGWASVDATTSDLDLPDPPTDLTQTGATSNSVDIAWTPPVAGPAPESYDYRVNGGSVSSAGLTTTLTISGLSPSTTYTIEVRSVAPDGVSSWVSVEATTSAFVPPVSSDACFDMVRGSGLRVTGLDRRGQVPDPVPYAVSKCVVKVVISDVVEAGSSEIVKNPEEERRLRLIRPAQTIRHHANIEFLRVDPGVYSLVAGVPLVLNDAGDVVGFDSNTHLAPVAFALEVWTRLAGRVCADGSPEWGYTLLPYLKGGRLSGFQFHNGLVSFNLIGAQTRRASRWGVGPYDLEGPFERLLSPVSRNASYRIFTTSAQPPAEVCGIQTTTDVLDNGTAADPMPDPSAPFAVDGGGAETSAYIIEGGRA